MTPHDIVHESRTLKLLRYRNQSPVEYAEPVLVCFSLVNRPYVMDLQPDRSVVGQLLRRGLDVYLIDWGIPTAADRTLGLQDYIQGSMQEVVDYVCSQANSTNVNLLGYCMGGTMATIFTSLHQAQVQNLILMAAPIDFGGTESLLNLWTREEYFDVDGLVDAFGNCPGWFLRMCFQQLKPVRNYVEKYVKLREKLEDDAFLENFFALERWADDSIPVAGETFRQFVKLLYQRNLLVQGQLRLNEVRIDLGRITCPLLMLTADFDHLVPPASSLALQHYINSKEIAHMSINAGHIGLAVSSKAHNQLWPDAAAWMAERSTRRK